MEQFKNFAIIEKQSFVSEFEWNGKEFYTYMVKFEGHDGLFRINRAKDYEQALIGAKLQFNISEDLSKVVKYRIVGFKEAQSKDEKITQLLKKRKNK